MTMRVFVRQYEVPEAPSSIQVTNIAAQVGGQSGATPLTALRNIVTSGGTGTGVKLQITPLRQQTIFVRLTPDASGTPQPIFPPENTRIEGHATNAPVTIADGGAATFTFDDVDTWLIS